MPRPDRYSRFAVLLHWTIAALVAAQFALGWAMQAIAKQPPGPRADAFNLHKSFGLLILATMIVRIAWRLSHRPPALPPMRRWQAAAARANHALLYVVLVVMPLAGYLGSAFSGYPVRFFGIVLPAWAARHDALKQAMSTVHLAASWVLAAAVALHVAAVIKHALEGDSGLWRMGWGRASRTLSRRAAATPRSP